MMYTISTTIPDPPITHTFEGLALGHAYDVVVDVKSNVHNAFFYAMRDTPVSSGVVWLEISNVSHIYDALSESDLDTIDIYIDTANVGSNIVPIHIDTILEVTSVSCRFDLYAESEDHSIKYETRDVLSATTTHITYMLDELLANSTYDIYYSLLINNPQSPDTFYCTRAHVYMGNVTTAQY